MDGVIIYGQDNIYPSLADYPAQINRISYRMHYRLKYKSVMHSVRIAVHLVRYI